MLSCERENQCKCVYTFQIVCIENFWRTKNCRWRRATSRSGLNGAVEEI